MSSARRKLVKARKDLKESRRRTGEARRLNSGLSRKLALCYESVERGRRKKKRKK